MTQTEIMVDETQPSSGPCAWCPDGTLTTRRLTIAKPRFRNDRGVRVMARAAQEEWACPHHFENVQVEGGDEL